MMDFSHIRIDHIPVSNLEKKINQNIKNIKEVCLCLINITILAVRKLDKFKYLRLNKPLKTEYTNKVLRNLHNENYENRKLYTKGLGLSMKR